MAGLSPAGAGASEAVKNAKAALDQASKDIADRSALIEKQRMDFNTKYQEDIAQEDDAIQQIYKSAQSAAEEFNAAYALKVQRLTRDIQQAQVNAQSEIQNASQAVTIANSAVSEAQSESMTANNRLTCAQKNNLPLTTTAGSKLSDQIDTLAQNNVYCAGATTACAGLANSAESLKKICPDPTANTSSTSSKGKPAATGAGKSVH